MYKLLSALALPQQFATRKQFSAWVGAEQQSRIVFQGQAARTEFRSLLIPDK